MGLPISVGDMAGSSAPGPKREDDDAQHPMRGVGGGDGGGERRGADAEQAQRTLAELARLGEDDGWGGESVQ